MTLTDRAPLLVVGIGNAIQMDDGVGIHVLRALEGRELPPGVELLDGGTMGIELLPWLEGREKVIFIDAVDAGEKPGTMFRFAPDAVGYDMIPKASVHEIGLVDAMQMAALTGRAPGETVIFGVQPGRIDWGEELTDELAAVIERMAALVMNEIHESVAERVTNLKWRSP
jgi:hydrogenase maturation protease